MPEMASLQRVNHLQSLPVLKFLLKVDLQVMLRLQRAQYWQLLNLAHLILAVMHLLFPTTQQEKGI
jgi:hypothetical protein